MSAQGYSDRLSKYSYRGKLNLCSDPDPPLSVLAKARILARRIRSSSHVVLHTGAGISTSAGIRDFRGPSGVWTTESSRAKTTDKQDGASNTCFEDAVPTLTHMAITAMHAIGFIHYVISQNVDGLHLRSGLPRSALSELHGNLFVDWCPVCKSETRRDSEVPTVGYKPSGKRCGRANCDGMLTDKALDWDDALPDYDLALAREHGDKADLAVVVGTSCQMDPARGLPFRGKGDVVIVNLSRTDYDKRAAFTVRAQTDAVFAVVAQMLDVRIPAYEREVEVLVQSSLQGKDLKVEMLVRWDGEERRRAMREIERVRYGTKCGNEMSVIQNGDARLGYKAILGGVEVGTNVEASIEVQDQGCVQIAHICPGKVMRGVVLTKREYNETMTAKVKELEEQARRGNKRKRDENWEARQWFVKGTKRGWQDCVSCNKCVWSGAGKREAHFAICDESV